MHNNVTQMNVEIGFDKFPFWNGTQNKHVDPIFLPFKVGFNHDGVITQTTPSHITDYVVNAYSNEYDFITAPPGCSSWSNGFGDKAIEFVVKHFGSLKGKRVLDIGGGSTYIGQILTTKYGVSEYTIIDPAISETTDNVAIEIIRDYFSPSTCPAKMFDLVLSFRCLEHVTDPSSFLSMIRSIIISSNGTAFLLFPETETQLKNGDMNVFLHEHLSYFTKSTFGKLAAGCGLELHKSHIQDDTLYCMLKPCKASTSAHSCDSELLIECAVQIQKNIKYFNDLIEPSLNNGQVIAFHGICNGLHNMLALSDFSSSDLDNVRLFDSDESKAGKFISMLNMPIANSLSKDYRKIDRVIVSAMTYYDQIKEFLSSFHGINPDNIYPMYRLSK